MYEINKPYMQKVLRNHLRCAGANIMEDGTSLANGEFEGLNYTPYIVDHKLLKREGLENVSNALKSSFQQAVVLGTKYGYRNAQVSVIAPTGTISFAMDCGATSIEPFFSHIVYKKLSGGGFMTVINPVIAEALKNLDYSDNEIDDILAYVTDKETVTENGFTYEKILDGKIEGAPHLKDEHISIFDTANKCGSGERYIGPMGHVKMVAAITPLISGAISKTVNLPKTASVDEFKDVVLCSFELGIKGITLYRDGCKASQPLNTSLNSDKDTKLEDFTYDALLAKTKELQKGVKHTTRNKPAGIRNGTTHPAQIDDVKIYTTVNRRESGEISEIYITTDREGTIITGLLNSLSKSISVMLQYHVPAQDISRMLRGQKYEPYGFVQKHPYIKYVSSISDLISKVIDIELGDYTRCQIKPENYDNNLLNKLEVSTKTALEGIDPQDFKHKKIDGERVYGSTCGTCSSTRMVRNGTCMVCLDCGSTTGCS